MEALRNIYIQLLERHYNASLSKDEQIDLDILNSLYTNRYIQVSNFKSILSVFKKILGYTAEFKNVKVCFQPHWAHYVPKDFNHENGDSLIVEIVDYDINNKIIYVTRENIVTNELGFKPINILSNGNKRTKEEWEIYHLSRKYFKLFIGVVKKSNRTKNKKTIEDTYTFDIGPSEEDIIMNAIISGNGDKYGY